MTMMLFIYVFVNVGMVTGILPWWACRCPS